MTILCTSTKISKPNAKTRRLWDGITAIANDPAYHDMTMGVRQIYYQCVVRGIVPENHIRQYRRVARATLQMRRQGELPWWKIRDGTRSRHKYTQHRSLGAALERWASVYRRDAMQEQSVHIELWIEKDSLNGFISGIAWEYGLPYAALRGQPSESFLWESGDAWHQLQKPVIVLYAGDFDSSGYFIGETLQERIQEHYPDTTVYHLGLNAAQVQEYDLPPSFEAKKSDSRTPEFVRRFGNKCVELDALPPVVLKQMYAGTVEMLIDRAAFDRARRTEEMERETLYQLANGYADSIARQDTTGV